MKVLILFLFPTFVFCQTPHLTGNVFINIKTGQFNCDLKLSNFPKTEDPAFMLNQGMNVQFIKVDNKNVSYIQSYDDAFKYSFNSYSFAYQPNIDTIKQSTVIEIKYTGSFPTYLFESENSYNDDMGTIAFKNNILRASHQTKWYPIFFDRNSGTKYSSVSYNITISSEKENSIFINGNTPQKTKSSQFVSTTPNDLMIYIGEYSFSKFKNLYFLNSNISKYSQAAIFNSATSIRKFFETTLKLKYEDTLTLAQIFTIGRKEQYEYFSFAVYPSYIINLDDLSKQIDKSTNEIGNIDLYRIFAHEMTHRFFGQTINSNTKYWGFYSETFAEYFAIKFLQQKFSRIDFKAYLGTRYFNEKNIKKNFNSLDSLNSDKSINALYTYYPLVIFGLEKIIGEERTYQVFREILKNANDKNLDYNSFKKLAKKSGISEFEWTAFEAAYVKSKNILPTIKPYLD